MHARVRTAGQRATAEFRGPLVIGEPVDGLRQCISDLLARGFRSIRLDLAGVPYADACGLGALVECRRRAVAAGAAIKISGVNGKLRELLRMTGLSLAVPRQPLRKALAGQLQRRPRSLADSRLPGLKFLVA